MLQSQRFNLYVIVISGKREKELEGITVGFDGMVAHTLDVWEVMIEELMDAGRKFHSFLICQREKSTSCLRLRASMTLRYTLVYM